MIGSLPSALASSDMVNADGCSTNNEDEGSTIHFNKQLKLVWISMEATLLGAGTPSKFLVTIVYRQSRKSAPSRVEMNTYECCFQLIFWPDITVQYYADFGNILLPNPVFPLQYPGFFNFARWKWE